ncbi:cyclic nucleotide-binding domain-containing protein [Pseudooceanicola aestuarii]|uniref:cyclic nucleotide-binding domain-containing protein n=1 Tax=Pseudooceanicola aestuarii TaxID=2697319 RepID=UPI0013D338A1|nr:cyclic nucleotide-binding domain-containing protein [Pseudooceanicola aestuarii]
MIEFLGWLAAALTLLTFAVRLMLPLRIAAVAASTAFLAYGLLASIEPLWALYALVLPLNLFRLWQVIGIRRRFARARSGTADKDWLRGLGVWKTLPKGDVVFRKGDPADKLYLLVSGSVEIVEIGAIIRKGEIFGEIGFFTSAHARTLTARCATECNVIAVDEAAFLAIHSQDPSFGVHITRLVASRLLDGMATRPDAYMPRDSERRLPPPDGGTHTQS